MNQTVSIIIPTHNKLELTQKCLWSLADTSAEIIVVDNASTDGTVEWLKEQMQAQVVFNPKNEGYAAACNIGAAESKRDILVMLNNDTEIQEGWLEPLVDALKGKVGVAGAKLLYPTMRVQHAGIGWQRRGSDWWPYHSWLGLPGRTAEACVSRDTLAVTGACLATPRKLYLKLGGMDEGFIQANFEDVDYCLRVKRAGYRIRYVAESVVIHHHGQTVTTMENGPGKYFEANLRRLMDKHGEWLEGVLA